MIQYVPLVPTGIERLKEIGFLTALAKVFPGGTGPTPVEGPTEVLTVPVTFNELDAELKILKREGTE